MAGVRVAHWFSTGKDNHFGFKQVATGEKQPLVNEVFHAVANKYDIMNDFMSLGIHRYWKHQMVNELGILKPSRVYTHLKSQPTVRILDVAGGTGDIAFKILDNHNRKSKTISHTDIKLTVLDINSSMLEEGKKRAQQIGLTEESTIKITIQTSSSYVLMLKNCPSKMALLTRILYHSG